MADDTAKKNGHEYLAACDRVLALTVGLVYARGVAASVDIDPGRVPSESISDPHQIRLTYKGATCVVPVDHETFMSEEFFRTLVLHQIKAAIDGLAASA